MKIKTIIVLGCLAGLISLCCLYEFSMAAPKDKSKAIKIAVVDIQKVLEGSQKYKTYQQQDEAEQQAIRAELENPAPEILCRFMAETSHPLELAVS